MSILINTLLAFSAKIGYLGIVLLMAIESSFIPFPSEVVIPPAAYLAAQGEFNIYLVILSGIVGSLIGAIINYLIAYSLGRKVIYALAGRSWARFLLIDGEKIEKAENYFRRYGRVSTFFGRLVPAVRQLISIPAGFSKMNFRDFLFFTFLGSSTWIIILAVLGYVFGENKELLERYYGEATYAAIIIAALAVVYLIMKSRRNKSGK